MPDEKVSITKETLNSSLKEVAKEYRKLSGKKMPAELIIVGGAAIVAAYDFRTFTTDIDAIIRASSAMKDAINNAGNKLRFPHGWINSDFIHTASYSDKLRQYSVHYKQFANIVNVRILPGEYIIAMKLRSSREYKCDLSDIVGILSSDKKNGTPITMDQIKTAVVNLYGSWDVIPQKSMYFLENAMKSENFDELYNAVREKEQLTHEMLEKFEVNYPGKVNQNNINGIVENLKQRQLRENEAETSVPANHRNIKLPTDNDSQDDYDLEM